MPSSSDLFVDRLVNGGLSTEFQTDVPDGFEVVSVKGEDGHVHVIYGDPEELVAAGFKKAKAKRKPAEKKAPAKAPAKKSAAKAKK